MGLWSWLRRWFSRVGIDDRPRAAAPRERRRRPPRPARLIPLKRPRPPAGSARSRLQGAERVAERPYRFARPSVVGGWLDLSRDGRPDHLLELELPPLDTPQSVADWLKVTPGQLAWLVHRFEEGQHPAGEQQAHYHYRWLRKRSGGKRLIESPKPLLRRVQQQILREILDKVPLHPAAHGFAAGRSIRSNAAPHAGQAVVLRLDLENFYPGVGYGRVAALFRSLGYCREAALWLARLATSSLPSSAVNWTIWSPELEDYLPRHLPQGAPTSPAIANLSAFFLDLRLSGLAKSFGARYTRYADDLTFSGDDRFLRSLRTFIPLAEQVIRQERFRTNRSKRRILRSHQRQQVTGVVVNRKVNVGRQEYDRLKAMLTNCIRRGPSTQNHQKHADFAAHLRGAIAHVSHLNAERGSKLRQLYEQIDWNR